jgi:hypothetical protein
VLGSLRADAALAAEDLKEVRLAAWPCSTSRRALSQVACGWQHVRRGSMQSSLRRQEAILCACCCTGVAAGQGCLLFGGVVGSSSGNCSSSCTVLGHCTS